MDNLIERLTQIRQQCAEVGETPLRGRTPEEGQAMSACWRNPETVKLTATRGSLRQATKSIQLIGAEVGHEGYSSIVRAIELAERSLDADIDFTAVPIDVLAHGRIHDYFESRLTLNMHDGSHCRRKLRHGIKVRVRDGGVLSPTMTRTHLQGRILLAAHDQGLVRFQTPLRDVASIVDDVGKAASHAERPSGTCDKSTLQRVGD